MTSALPEMVTIAHCAELDLGADEAWERVGGFFDLHRYLDVTCEAVSGDGGLGSVRLVDGAIVEPLVGCGHRSYTYAQTAGPMSAHTYHGCVACEPVSASSCELVYAIVYDQRGIAPDRREAERARLTARSAGAHAAMIAAAGEARPCRR